MITSAVFNESVIVLYENSNKICGTAHLIDEPGHKNFPLHYKELRPVSVLAAPLLPVMKISPCL